MRSQQRNTFNHGHYEYDKNIRFKIPMEWNHKHAIQCFAYLNSKYHGINRNTLHSMTGGRSQDSEIQLEEQEQEKEPCQNTIVNFNRLKNIIDVVRIFICCLKCLSLFLYFFFFLFVLCFPLTQNVFKF